jgi:predicted SAM-dependent methyltransferase
MDAADEPGVDLVWDVRRPLPFPSRTVDLIYTEHLLEHLARSDTDRLLAECQRVLRPSGRIRIGVPDAGLYLRAYIDRNDDFFELARHLGGATEPLRTPIEVINQMFRMGGAHKYAWDLETLTLALRESGFRDICQHRPGEASSPILCLDDPAHAFETLYVEAATTTPHGQGDGSACPD